MAAGIETGIACGFVRWLRQRVMIMPGTIWRGCTSCSPRDPRRKALFLKEV